MGLNALVVGNRLAATFTAVELFKIEDGIFNIGVQRPKTHVESPSFKRPTGTLLTRYSVQI